MLSQGSGRRKGAQATIDDLMDYNPYLGRTIESSAQQTEQG